MVRTRALAAGKLALMAGSGGREGAGQQTDGELVGAMYVWVGGFRLGGGQNVCDLMTVFVTSVHK